MKKITFMFCILYIFIRLGSYSIIFLYSIVVLLIRRNNIDYGKNYSLSPMSREKLRYTITVSKEFTAEKNIPEK